MVDTKSVVETLNQVLSDMVTRQLSWVFTTVSCSPSSHANGSVMLVVLPHREME